MPGRAFGWRGVFMIASYSRSSRDCGEFDCTGRLDTTNYTMRGPYGTERKPRGVPMQAATDWAASGFKSKRGGAARVQPLQGIN
jgi:hypothetical protein